MSLRAILTSPIRSRRAWLVVALLALGYVAVDFVTFQRAMVQRKPTLKRWLPYAAELGSADDLYERHPDYLYPPFFLVMLRPLTWLSPAGAAAMWQLAKYAAAGLLFAATFNLLRRTRPVSALVTGLTLLLAIRFVHSDLRHGNVNLFLAALVTGAAWLMARNRRALAGAAVAAAAAVKVSPAIWLLLLLYQRQWRALAGAAVGLALLLEVVPLFVLPAESNHRLLRSWYRHVVAGYVARGQIDSTAMNQSLVAVTRRWLGAPDEPRAAPTAPARLSEPALRWLQRVLAAALLLTTGWTCRETWARRGAFEAHAARRLALDWALLAPPALALSGYTWTGHFCLLVLPLALLVDEAAGSHSAAPGARLVARAALVAAALIFVGITDAIGDARREQAAAWGLPLVGALGIWLGLLAVRRGCGRAKAPQARNQ